MLLSLQFLSLFDPQSCESEYVNLYIPIQTPKEDLRGHLQSPG